MSGELHPMPHVSVSSSAANDWATISEECFIFKCKYQVGHLLQHHRLREVTLKYCSGTIPFEIPSFYVINFHFICYFPGMYTQN